MPPMENLVVITASPWHYSRRQRLQDTSSKAALPNCFPSVKVSPVKKTATSSSLYTLEKSGFHVYVEEKFVKLMNENFFIFKYFKSRRVIML